MIWIVYVLLVIGTTFQLLGTLALHRFPDVYTRLHGTTLCTTFGSIFLYLGIVLYGIMMGWLPISVRAFIVMLLILVTNPTGAHAIARAAHRSGVKPKKAVVDKLQGAGHDI